MGLEQNKLYQVNVSTGVKTKQWLELASLNIPPKSASGGEISCGILRKKQQIHSTKGSGLTVF